MTTVTSYAESGPSASFPVEEALRLLEIADIAFNTVSVDELARAVLPIVVSVTRSPSVVLYLADPRLSTRGFFVDGTLPGTMSDVEHLCATQWAKCCDRNDPSPIAVPSSQTAFEWMLYPLLMESSCSGFLGLTVSTGSTLIAPEVVPRLLDVLAHAIDRPAERVKANRQLTHLNTYLTVSSLLVQSLNLHEMLEGVLYCFLDAVSAEVASVLLLNDDMKTFRLYQTEGPAKPELVEATFALLKDIAGYVLQTQQPVVIRDMDSDPRFSGRGSSESHYHTRNLIAVPLAIGEEQVGALIVLNRVDGGTFTPDEKMLMLSIAGEIALAIRNAKMFEFVANVYCRRRQGQFSCKGCERPLGTWTRCIEYREDVNVSGLWRISDGAE